MLEKILQTNQTISDYLAHANRSQQDFLTRYPHPFLVMVGQLGGEAEGSDSAFLTKAFLSLEDRNATLGGGPVLDPQAVVLPVKKKKAPTSSQSPLASTVFVGRTDDNDLVIASSGISKHHFYITRKPFSDDDYTISDNGSTNYTFVNMKRVQPSSRFPLKSGDKITLGQAVSLRFYLAADFWENLQENLRHAP